MKIALTGYGKMGHMIEQIAKDRGHEVVCIIDKDNTADFNSVIGYNTVAALNELYGCFAFAHAAFPHKQNTFAVNLHQNAVAGNAGGQFHV